jgi:hypothetical protein
MSKRTYYQILQVDPAAQPEIIEAAYRRLVRIYHPDINRAPDATTRMQQINAAYDVLSDPVRRAAYDRELHGSPRTAAPPPGARARPTGTPRRPPEALHFTFLVVSLFARKALSIAASAAPNNGAPLFLQKPRGSTYQLWRFEPLHGPEHGWCRIRCVGTGKYLSVSGAGTMEALPVVQWSWEDGDHQKWKLIEVGSTFVIQARHSEKVLDVPPFLQGQALPVTQWNRHDGDNQRWLLLKP